MPRNSSGTMSAPAGQPVVSGTVISSSTFNSLVADLVAELTDSASRSGKGAFSAPVKTPDGSAASPAHTFTSEATGFFRSAAGELAVSILGALAAKLTAAGFEISVASPIIKATAANAQINIQGNRAGGDAGDEVAIVSTATRTAGYLLGIWSNASVPVKKLQVDYQGLLSLASQAGPIQPASMVTAITPGANWTAGNGLAYWKDCTGIVRIKGTATWATGATNPMATLPAGFRPGSPRYFAINNETTGVPVSGFVDTNGNISMPLFPTNGQVVSFDGIAFLAEA